MVSYFGPPTIQIQCYVYVGFWPKTIWTRLEPSSGNLLAVKDLRNAHLVCWTGSLCMRKGLTSGWKSPFSWRCCIHLHATLIHSLIEHGGGVTGMQIDLMRCQLKCAINFIWFASHYRICNCLVGAIGYRTPCWLSIYPTCLSL